MKHLINGIRLSFTDRQLRAYIVKPLLISIAIYAVIAFVVSYATTDPVRNILSNLGLDGAPLLIATRVIIFLAWGLVAGPVFFGINGMFSSLLWEKLSLKTELDQFNTAPQVPTPLPVAIADTVRRMPMTFGTAVITTILGFTPIGWLSAWPSGRLALLDFTAPAFARRGILFPAQRDAAKRLPDADKFGLACGFISLFPLVNMLCLPGCIIGATLLVQAGDAITPSDAGTSAPVPARSL